MTTILVVDDEFNLRRTICEILEARGYVTVSAATGREALESVNSSRPDLVLTDVMMPGMTGHELVRQLRKLSGCAELPVALMSSIDPALHPNGTWNAVLRKPFQADALLGLVEELTRTP